MAVIKKSTVGMSSKTLQTVAMPVATVTKSEPRLTRPPLEATSSALSDTSILALTNKATVVAMTMMMAAMVAVVKRRAVTVVTVDMDVRKRVATDVRSRAAMAVTVATDVKRRAATVGATAVVRNVARNVVTRAVTVVAMVVAAAVMSDVRRVVVMAVARRVDMAAITTDVKTRVVSAEVLLTNMSVKVKEAMDVTASVVAAMNTKTTTTVVTDAGKLFDDHFYSVDEGSQARRVEYTRYSGCRVRIE
jgi:hypothetical protein